MIIVTKFLWCATYHLEFSLAWWARSVVHEMNGVWMNTTGHSLSAPERCFAKFAKNLLRLSVTSALALNGKAKRKPSSECNPCTLNFDGNFLSNFCNLRVDQKLWKGSLELVMITPHHQPVQANAARQYVKSTKCRYYNQKVTSIIAFSNTEHGFKNLWRASVFSSTNSWAPIRSHCANTQRQQERTIPKDAAANSVQNHTHVLFHCLPLDPLSLELVGGC